MLNVERCSAVAMESLDLEKDAAGREGKLKMLESEADGLLKRERLRPKLMVLYRLKQNDVAS